MPSPSERLRADLVAAVEVGDATRTSALAALAADLPTCLPTDERAPPTRRHTGMTDQSDRFRRIAADFTRVVDAVPADAWDAPAPPEGWRARDVIGHLVEWLPGLFLDTWGVARPSLPSVEDDPAGAWAGLRDAVQAALDDPAVADEVREIPPGPMSLAAAVDMLGTPDVLMHQWDLARATGGDERLDPDEVHALLVGMEPIDEILRQSGHYGPRVEVPADADEQTRLIAFIGRQP